MTLCPMAIVAGCRNCPIVAVCPLKGVIGNYEKKKENIDKGASTGTPNPADRPKR